MTTATPVYGELSDKSKLCIANQTATIEAYEGTVRSAKTITTLMSWLRFCRTGPAGDLAMVGRTERTVYRNLIQPLEQMVGAKRCKYNRGTGVLILLGRTVHIIGANNEASVTKIQGLTLAGLYLDEAAELPESFFNMATTRLSVEGAKMWLTCNPGGRNHWLKTKWLDKASLWVTRTGEVLRFAENLAMRVHRYSFTIEDNPYLSKAFVERLKASYVGVWYRRYILGEWTNAEGAIFDMWDPDLHVVSVLPEITRRIVGVDYGTTNATAAIEIGLGVDGRLYATREWRHDSRAGATRWTDAQLSAGLRAWLHPDTEWVMVDPSAASFRLQLLRDGLGNVAPASNAVSDGIREVASLMSVGMLKVSTDCPGLIAEKPEYAWDPKATERGEDEPIKKNDHSLDGERYAVRAALRSWNLNIEGVAA